MLKQIAGYSQDNRSRRVTRLQEAVLTKELDQGMKLCVTRARLRFIFGVDCCLEVMYVVLICKGPGKHEVRDFGPTNQMAHYQS
jgi:hypothetical protein